MAANQRPRVIVGVSQSLAGLRALRLAAAEARARGAVLHAVRMWNFAPTWASSPPEWFREIERDTAAFLADAFAKAMGGMPTDIPVVAETIFGPPPKRLVAYACRDDDVLFLGSRQRGRLRRLLRPSTTRYCLAHATCPVVAVPVDEFARTTTRGLRKELAKLAG
jgi:nucleotide-binding universal stress UspA family protein